MRIFIISLNVLREFPKINENTIENEINASMFKKKNFGWKYKANSTNITQHRDRVHKSST